MDRAKQINANGTDFVFGISRLAVFGSYLTDKPKLGDLDIAVELRPRGVATNSVCTRCEGKAIDRSGPSITSSSRESVKKNSGAP